MNANVIMIVGVVVLVVGIIRARKYAKMKAEQAERDANALCYCPSCGQVISVMADSCPYCGRPMQTHRPKKKEQNIGWVIVGAILMAYGIMNTMSALIKMR